MSTDDRVTAVVATRDRRCQLLDALGRLASLPERPALVVVDNGSSDRTAAAARSNHPEARVLALGRNLGAGARTEGVRLASTPYVAFSDDDSWWQSGALARAADVLDAYPRLALVAAKILVGAQRDADPACELMAASPLARDGLPGPAVMGFLACGAIVRRSAFLEVGGFDARLGIGGEEKLLALDLAAAGWRLAYVDDVVAEHQPPRRVDSDARRRIQARNEAWTAWLRRPASGVAAVTARLARRSVRDDAVRAGLRDAVRHGGWTWRERRPVGPAVEAAIRAVEASGDVSRTSNALLIDGEL